MENNQFVTDAELTTEINKSLSQLDMLLISKFNDYKLSTALISTTNTNQLALPAGFLKLRGVDVWYNSSSSDGYHTLKQFAFQHRNKTSYPGVAGTLGVYHNIEYRLEGSVIVLLPSQIASQYKYRVWYTPDYTPLVNTSDTLQTYIDSQAWHEYGVVDCCIKVLEKQDLNPATFQQQKEEVKDLILRLSAPNRNAAEPASVVDTRGVGSWSGGYGWDW